MGWMGGLAWYGQRDPDMGSTRVATAEGVLHAMQHAQLWHELFNGMGGLPPVSLDRKIGWLHQMQGLRMWDLAGSGYAIRHHVHVTR